MRSGRLRHLVTIQVPVETQDSYGQKQHTWGELAQVWAGLEEITGREKYSAEHINPEVEIKAIIRYLPTITAQCRLVHNGIIYQLLAPPLDIDQRNREMHLLLKRVLTHA